MRLPADRARRFVLAIALLGAFAVPCAFAATLVIDGGPMVEGSGNTVEEARAVSGYTSVAISGPFDVTLKHTGNEKAVVHADDNVAPLIDTRVERGTLVIEARKNVSFRTRSKLSVVVEFKQLDRVHLRGSGDVSADDVKAAIFECTMRGSGNVRIGNLDADTVAVSVLGSGDFRARGRAGKIGVVIRGSGDVYVEDLQATAAAVNIAGSGDARVFATETLQARIAGSGDVRYRGSPQVEKKVAGSGEVKPMR